MEIEFGKRYERSQNESPEQFIGALAEFSKHRLHGLVLRLELVKAGAVTGVIDAIDPDGVTLERGDETLIGVYPATEIFAFALAAEPPIDHSDELRGW